MGAENESAIINVNSMKFPKLIYYSLDETKMSQAKEKWKKKNFRDYAKIKQKITQEKEREKNDDLTLLDGIISSLWRIYMTITKKHWPTYGKIFILYFVRLYLGCVLWNSRKKKYNAMNVQVYPKCKRNKGGNEKCCTYIENLFFFSFRFDFDFIDICL